jgi:hypothetical protein
VLALALAAAPQAARGQETIPPPRIAAVLGAFVHDLGVGGTSTLLGLRLDLPLLGFVSVEPGLLFTRYRGQPATGASEGADVSLLFGDLQLQGRYPAGRFSPYLGVGVGAALDFADDRGAERPFVALTYTGSAGVRMSVGARLVALAEARLRGIEHLERDATELVLGLALPF